MNDKVRIDKWLWAARFSKTRGQAREAIKGGKVELNGTRVKPGRTLTGGDKLTIRRGDDLYEITVLPAAMARREAAAKQRKLDYQARTDRQRRPDKKQRRQIVEFTKRT